jgi:hypothetical protein
MYNGRLMISVAHKLVSALVCDAERNFVAAGIENPEDGPNSSPVYIWYLATCLSNQCLLY